MQKKYAKLKEVNRMQRIITEYREPGVDGNVDGVIGDGNVDGVIGDGMWTGTMGGDGYKIFYHVIL